jgi:hypothetical protein
MHAKEKGVNIVYSPNVLLRFCSLLQSWPLLQIIIRICRFFSFVLPISYYTLAKRKAVNLKHEDGKT